MTDTFETSMAELASSIATKAAAADTSLSESIDALKALTPYLALRLKQNGSTPQEAAETSFADFAAEINGTGDKDGQVRGGSRRTRKHVS